jgi:RNA-binding protein 5/10
MPALYAHSEPRKVRIDYAAPPSSAPEGHQAGYQAPPAQSSRGHDGMRDVGQPGGGKRVLLSRTHGDEVVRRVAQEIARLLGKQGSEKQAEAAISRVVMVVDRVGSMSWGLSFVELVTAEVSVRSLGGDA